MLEWNTRGQLEKDLRYILSLLEDESMDIEVLSDKYSRQSFDGYFGGLDVEPSNQINFKCRFNVRTRRIDERENKNE